jgi:glycerol kinase
MTTVLAIRPEHERATAVVIDGSGTARGRSEVAVPRPRTLPGGGLAQDPQAVLAAVVDAGRTAAAQGGTGIDVVTVVSHAGGVLAWEPDTGLPLSGLIVRADRRAEELCETLRAHADRVAGRTGLPLDACRAAPRLAWLRSNVTGDGVATTLDSWLVHQLTGEFVTDAATAGESLLTAAGEPSWDAEMLGLFGLLDERLPEIVPCDRLVGFTIAFHDTLAVGGLIPARQAALLGAGCLRPGEATCTFAGSEAVVLLNAGDAAVRPRPGLASSTAWRARGRTTRCVSGGVSTAAVRWIRQLGYITDVDDIDEVAATDAGGVLAVPAFGGLGPPWWRPEARASLSGMTSFTTVGHIVAAVMEGLAAQIAAQASYMAEDLGRPLTRLRIAGSLGRCRTLVQAIADLVQIEVEVCEAGRTALLGATAMARLAVNPALGLADAVVATESERVRVHAPRWSSDHAADFLGRWSVAARRS